MIDIAINATLIGGTLYLLIGFVAFTASRATKTEEWIDQTIGQDWEAHRAAVEVPTCLHCDEPAEWSEQYCQEHWEQHCADQFWQVIDEIVAEEPQALQHPETIFTDTVVPFHRTAKPQPTDPELIALAKRLKFPGASKWSRSRKLSVQVRTSILHLAESA